MPELPEVERVRRELAERLTDRRVSRAVVHRPDVVHGDARRSALLQHSHVALLERHGKQLAVIGNTGRAICIHLGMSGQLFHLAPGASPPRRDHIHLAWSLVDSSGAPAGRLIFRDPRRFGGVWTFPNVQRLYDKRWSALGPDALTITTIQLRSALEHSSRAIKAALLDQAAIAGVGNIYADEALFAARIHPTTPCTRLSRDSWRRLAQEIRRVLKAALRVGGSTIRDYVGGDGVPGGYQNLRKVYDRAGQPCLRCQSTLDSAIVAQRTTVWCPQCQSLEQPTSRLPKHRTNHTFSTTRPGQTSHRCLDQS